MDDEEEGEGEEENEKRVGRAGVGDMLAVVVVVVGKVVVGVVDG